MTRYETLREMWHEETAGEQTFPEWLQEHEIWVKNRNSDYHSIELKNQLNASIK